MFLIKDKINILHSNLDSHAQLQVLKIVLTAILTSNNDTLK